MLGGAVAVTDDYDIPEVRPKQLGIFDVLVNRDELAREVPSGVKQSEREITRQDHGTDSSGHQRALTHQEVRESLEAFFQQAKLAYGYDWAVLVLFRMLARDPTYLNTAPDWILALIAEEKELLFAMFGGKLRGARDEDDDDEEDDEQEAEDAELYLRYQAAKAAQLGRVHNRPDNMQVEPSGSRAKASKT